jgi:hypothetical protein
VEPAAHLIDIGLKPVYRSIVCNVLDPIDPVPGLVPGTHVFSVCTVGVFGRDGWNKSRHGDLRAE